MAWADALSCFSSRLAPRQVVPCYISVLDLWLILCSCIHSAWGMLVDTLTAERKTSDSPRVGLRTNFQRRRVEQR